MIRFLAVQSYRSLRELTLPLGRLTVITGANGSGKSSLYRSLRLLADASRNGAVAALAMQGGLPSTMWAGPDGGSRFKPAGGGPVQGTVRPGPVALRLGFAGDEFGYAIDLGLPTPPTGAFAFDPVIKREWVWAGPSPRPSALLADRHNNVVKVRDDAGRWAIATSDLRTFDSMLTELADPRATPELLLVREQMRSWRFYDQLRTDADAPARSSQIGTRTMVLSSDGADLAAALQTIIEIGDAAGLRAAVDHAFPGSAVQIDVLAGRFELIMTQHGLLRPLRSAELSDGTVRYLCWIAALLTPRPPELLVLNEPENSLHQDLLDPLAALIAGAARRCQVLVVSHSPVLLEAIREVAADQGQQVAVLELVKELGVTRLLGQRVLDEPSWTWPGR